MKFLEKSLSAKSNLSKRAHEYFGGNKSQIHDYYICKDGEKKFILCREYQWGVKSVDAEVEAQTGKKAAVAFNQIAKEARQQFLPPKFVS